METVHPLVKKLSARGPISGPEVAVLEQAVARIRQVETDVELVAEGSKPTDSTLLLKGFVARYRMMAGGKRQILGIHVEGDFVDLHSFLLKRMDHGIFTMTPCTVASVPHTRLTEITERFPHLTRMLWLSTLIDAAIHREWIVGLGRRTAIAKLGHLICELFVRLSVVGATKGHSFQVPITQEELADCLGLSIVHLNRSLKELRAKGLLTWQATAVTIEDWPKLKELAEFDPSYLSLGENASRF